MPRKFSSPCGALKEAHPEMLVSDPRAPRAQKASRDHRSNMDAVTMCVYKVRFPIVVQASSATWSKRAATAVSNPSSLARVQAVVLDFVKVKEDCAKSSHTKTLEF